MSERKTAIETQVDTLYKNLTEKTGLDRLGFASYLETIIQDSFKEILRIITIGNLK